MNRKTAKLLRGFCKVTDQSYRLMKKNYYILSSEERRDSKKKLAQFWKENSEILNHRKYYDLKKKLAAPEVANSLGLTEEEVMEAIKRKNAKSANA